MAEVVQSVRAPVVARPAAQLWAARLALGWTALIGTIIFFLGTGWDIHWHTYIGRDRTLIAPHLLMLGGVALSGIAALAALLFETARGRGTTPATRFAGTFRGALGAYVAGFSALEAGVAFALDAYWHTLYGIDVAIWAPFHVMFVSSMAGVALGAAFMLASGTRLAEGAGSQSGVRWGQRGGVLAFATFMGVMTILLFDALSDNHPKVISFGPLDVGVFPLMAGALGGFTLIAARYSLPLKWAALWVALVYVGLALLDGILVGPATDILMAAEKLAFRRPNDLHVAQVFFAWPLAPLLAGFLVDRVANKLRLSENPAPPSWGLILAAAICALPISAIPFLGLGVLLDNSGAAGFVVTLLAGIPATWIAGMLGYRIGLLLRSLVR